MRSQRRALLLFGISFVIVVPNAWSLDAETRAFFAAPAVLALKAYRWVGPSKGITCPMTPSDSAFAAAAFRRFGPWGGLWRTADRLHRCGHDLADYPTVRTSAGLRFADPLDRHP
jgi:putative component of membrane protein insertase Oxa1/YidC/SpoIIIJ protein YidD